eukprot:gene7111-biopygen6953
MAADGITTGTEARVEESHPTIFALPAYIVASETREGNHNHSRVSQKACASASVNPHWPKLPQFSVVHGCDEDHACGTVCAVSQLVVPPLQMTCVHTHLVGMGAMVGLVQHAVASVTAQT